ncbi:MAG TPA: hypothetical protein VLJ15_08975 [Gammaproteobacteria bacterium]|nr:hypothetical protein [Gammaproteobacteria bacterium]
MFRSCKVAWKQVVKQVSVFTTTLVFSVLASANPVLDNVAAGQASVQQTPGSTVVNQSSGKAILNWKSFNIGAGERTHFQQPANGIALNRINPGQGASEIYGHLSATGKIILVNQAGIFFGPGSFVNVGGIIASTSDLSDANFMAGKYKFDQPSPYNGSIINEGTIRAAKNGLVALIGTGVRNDGTIQARSGSIVLASGNKFTVDLSGDGLVNFTVDEEATSAGVDRNGKKLRDGIKNTGKLIADGGTIILTARDARGVVDNAINMKGVAQARSVSSRNGVIILDGGDGNVRVSGTLDASGKRAGTTGGSVKILARTIHVKPHAVINVSGDAGGGDVLVSSTQSTRVDKGASIRADAMSKGDGGHVKVWSDNDTVFSGSVSARGGANGGNGGFVETSGNTLTVNGITMDLRAPLGTTGTWLLDPENLTIQNAGPTTADFASDTYTANVANSILTVADLEAALGTASIIVQTVNTGGSQAGDITVADPIYWNNSNSLTLDAWHSVTINASISNTSTGSLNINADTGLQTTGTIQINNGIYLAGGTLTLSAPNVLPSSITTGPAGVIDVYNFTLTQGRWKQTDPANPAFNVANDFQFADDNTAHFIRTFGTEVIGGTTYNILGDVYGLQGIENSSLGNYSLDHDIDASVTAHWFGGAGFLPLAQQSSFTGSFNGQNHVINNLTIDRPTDQFVGLFFALADPVVIKNLGLTNIDFTGAGGPGNQILGGIVGVMQGGTLDNVFVTGVLNQPVTSNNSGIVAVGGLIGDALDAQHDVKIKNSYNAATVNANNPFGEVGGLIGINIGSDISTSYNSGTLNGPTPIGGLVGLMQSGSITDSYNIGTVNSSVHQGGGLIAVVVGSPPITNTYSSGLITGGDTQGGLIFSNATAVVSNSFWDTTTSGQSNASAGGAITGATGITTAQALIQNTYTGWDFNTVWYAMNYDNTGASSYTRPMLRSEYSTTIRNGHQLELIALDGSQTYTLGNDINLGSAILNKADIWGTDNSSGSGFVSLGTSLSDHTAFTGTLNGNGYLIDGLYVKWDASTASSETYPALFGFAKTGSVIENIGLTNVNMTATADDGHGASPYALQLSGTLERSYATGAVTTNGVAGTIKTGGLVSILEGGTITDSYTTVDVTATQGGTTFSIFAGGLAGEANLGSFINSYSTGLITAPSPGNHLGGFLGADDGTNTFTNNFWNTATSGTAAGVDNDNVSGVTGLDSTQMKQQANFTGWDFSNTNTGVWGIIEGKTNPFLQVINTGISGTADPSLVGADVAFKVEGKDLSNTTTIAGDGSFYVVARTVDIATNDDLLAYLTSGGTSNAISYQPNAGGTITGLTLNPNMVTVGDASTGVNFINLDLSLAGGHSGITNGSAILYTAAGPNLLVGNGTSTVTFATTPTAGYFLSYIPGEAITPSSGTTLNYLFNGAVTLISDTTLTGSSATFQSTLDGGSNLTLGTNTTFNGTVGQSDPLTSLTSNGTSTINTSAISTTGNQTYNDTVTLGASPTLHTVSGNIIFNGDITGTGRDMTLQGSGNNTFTLSHDLTFRNLVVHSSSGTNTLQLETNSPIQAWTVTASNLGNVGITGLTGTATFDHIANLIGGSNTDTFTLNGGTLSGFIHGGGGTSTIIGDNVTNTWTITGSDSGTATGVGGGFSQIQNLTGGSGLDRFILSGGTLSGAVDGAGGSNSLTGDNVANVWTVTGPNSGTATGVGSFSHIGELVAGSSTNSFILNGGTLTADIDGASGTNSLTADNVANTWHIVGPDDGDVTGVPSFAHIQTLIGGSSTDNFILSGGTVSGSIDGAGGNNTLQANNVTNTWTISGSNSGAVTGVTGGFTHIQNLTGGTGADNVTFAVGGSLGGTIDGGGGSGVNTIDMSALSTSVNVILSGLGSGRGFAGTATAVFAGFDNIDNIAGTSGSNALAGPDLANVWVVNGPDSGTLTSTNSLGFEFFHTLFGGSVSDSFTLTGGGTLGGNINGNNSNTTLTVDNGTTSNWLITNNNTGTVTGLGGDFTGVPNLVGGTGADHFTIEDGVSISTINGGGSTGVNTIDLSQFGSNLNITLSALGSSRGFAGTSNLGISTGFDNIDTITGPPSVNNSITGANLSNAWVINGIDRGSVTSTNAFNFIAFQNLNGGSGADSFTLSGGGTLSGSIDGGGGSNTLTGDNVSNTWNITNNNVGTVTGVTGGFSNIQNLVGGTGNDNFIFGNNDSISGSLNGGAGGTNTLDISAENSALNVNLQTATVTGVIGTTFSNLNDFIGSSSNNDTLTGTNATHSWNITANNGGNIDNAITFTSFSNLTGGTGNDTFIFSDGKSIRSLDGGSGTNTLNSGAYTSNVNVNLQADTATGISTTFSNISSFIGGSGNNTLTGASGAHSWTITAGNGGNIDSTTTFASFGNLVGGSGADSFVLSGGTLSGSINGSGGSDTLTGDNVSNTWNITNNNTGTVTGVTGGFSNIQNLVGGTGNDNFIFGNNDSISGSLNGGAGGTNTLDISAESSALNVNLQTATVTGVIGTTFSNLNDFIGSGSTNDTLTGTNGTHSWNITANNGGNIDNGTTFASFSNLAGGTGNDTFIFSDGRSVRSLDGGSGTNTMNLSAYTTAVSVNLQADTATGISTTFSNIGSFTGNGNNGTLTGPNGTQTWNVTGSSSGTVGGSTFASFGNLTGGTGNDSFVFSDGQSISGSLNGGSGTNSLDLSAYTTLVSVNLQAATATGVGATYSNITSFTGNGSNGTLTGPNGTQTWNVTGSSSGTVGGSTFVSFGNLTGGTGNDSFIFGNGNSISGSLNGGAGTNSLDLSAVVSPASVNLQTATVTGIIGTTFSNIGNFVGNNANTNTNTLTATSSGTHSWSISQNNGGSLDGSTTFSDFGTLVGGSGDTFALGTGRTINSISATAGTLDESAYTTAVAVNGGTNTATGVGSMSGITSFIGGSNSGNTFTNTIGGNTWTISTNNTGSIAGKNFIVFGNLTGGAADSFVFSTGSSAVTGNLTGSGSTLNLAALSSPTVNLGTSTASGIGGTFSGMSTFIGGGSNSTIIGPSSNTAFTIASADGGTAGSSNFAGFGNLTGGSGTNTFAFTGNGSVSGVIDGGNTTNTNTMDFTGYGQTISLVLALPVGNQLNAGSLLNNSSVGIGTFAEMQQVIGTNVGLSTLTLPNKPVTVVYTNPPIDTNGSIADPFFFINMKILNPPPTPTPTPTPEPAPTPNPEPNNINNVFISGTTALIWNNRSIMEIVVDGVDAYDDYFASSPAVNANLHDLIHQQVTMKNHRALSVSPIPGGFSIR